MAQLKTSLNQQSLNSIFSQLQDFIKKVENETIDLNLNNNNIKNQLDNFKRQITDMSSSIKPIDLPIDVAKSKEDIAKIEGNFDDVIKKCQELGKIINISPKFDKDGQMESFVLQLQQAEGIIDKINMKSGKTSLGSSGEVTPNGQFSVQSIAENDKILQIEQQKSREIEKQNADREKALQYEQQVRQALADEEVKQEQITQKIQQQVQNWQDSKNIQMQRLQQSNQEAMKNSEIQQQYKDMQQTISNMGKDSAGNFDKSFDTAKLNEANNQFKQLGANVNGYNQELKNSTGIMGEMSNHIQHMGEMIIAGGLLFSLANGFKEACDYAQELDKSITNISMVTDVSVQKASSLVDQYRQLASSMGQNDTDFLKGAENYLRAGMSDTDTTTMLKNNAMASAISGEGNAEISDSLLAMKNAYSLTADQVGLLVDKLSTLDSKSSSSFSSIAEGMKRSAANAQEVGVQYDRLASYITTVQDVTHKSASTIGESFRSIFSRLTNVAAGKSEDDTDINQVEQVLSKQNIAIRETSGEWRNMGDVIDDLGKHWNGYNSVTKSQIATTIAGKEQMNTFLTLMQNYGKEQQFEIDATNSAGSAQQKYAVYLESSESKVNKLKDSLHNMWSGMVNSSEINGAVGGLDNFIKKFGNIPEIITVATTAFLLFKGQAISGLVADLMSVVAGETATTIATVGLTSVFNALKVAIATNPIGMIALGVTTAVSAFMLLKNSTQDQIDKMDEMSQKAQQTQADVDGLKSQAETLQDLTNKTSLNNDEKSKLKQINDDLTSKYPELISWYDEETQSFKVNIQQLDELIKKKQELAMQENANNLQASQDSANNAQKAIDDANKQLQSGKTFKYITEPGKPGRMGTADLDTEDRSKLFDTINKNQQILDKSNQSINQSIKYINDYSSAQQKAGKSTDEINNSLKTYGYTQSQIDNAIAKGKSLNNSDDDLKKLISDYNTLSNSGNKSADVQKQLNSVTTQLANKYGDLEVATDASGNATIKNTNVLQDHAKALGMDAKASGDAKNQIQSLDDVQKNLATSISKASSNIQTINQVLQEHAKTGEWNQQEINALVEKYPELINAMGDDKAMTETLTKLKDDEKNAAENSLNQQIAMLKTEVQQALNMYGLDISNFADAQSAKTALANQESKNRISILEKELQVQADAADAIARDPKTGGKVTGRGGGTPYDKALQQLNQAKQDLANQQANIDEYFNLNQLKNKADSMLANVGNENDDGKKNTTSTDPAKKQASEALTAQSRDIANQSRDIATQSRNLDMQSHNLESESRALDAQSKTLNVEKQNVLNDLDKNYKAEQQHIDDVIKGYNKELDALKEKKQLQDDANSALDYQNKLIKDQQALNDAQNQKTVMMTDSNGNITYMADQQKVDAARESLAKDQEDYRRWQADQAIQAQENAISKNIQIQQDAKDAGTTAYNNKKDSIEASYQAKLDAIDNQKQSISDRQQSISDAKSDLDNQKNDIASQQNGINDSRNNLNGYADGTDNAEAGIHPISENGYEIVIGKQARNFQGGEVVIPHEQSANILNGNANLNSQVQSTKNTLNAIGQTINNNKNLVEKPTNDLLNEVDNKVQDFVDYSPQYSHDTNKNMGDSVTNNKNLVKNPIDNLIREVENQYQQFVDGAGQYGKNSNNNIGGSVTNNAESVYNPTRTLITNVKKLLDDFVASTHDEGKGLDTQIGQGITDGEGDLDKIVGDLTNKIITKFRTDFGIHSPSTVMHEIGGFLIQGLINGMNEADIEKFITDKVSGMTGVIQGQVVAVPGNVSDWLTEALKATNTDLNWLGGLQKLASYESGDPGTLGTGSATLVNSEPVGNEYATGLLQTLPSTFQSYMMKGHGNIMNPIDNAIAAINYIKDQYGSVYNTPLFKSRGKYVGYQTGVDSALEGMHPVAENGMELVIGQQLKNFNGGEKVIPYDQTMQIMSMLNRNSINGYNPINQPYMPPSYEFNLPKTNTTPNTTTNITVQNVDLSSVTDVEGFVTGLKQYGYTHN